MIGLTFKLVAKNADQSILGWSNIEIISTTLLCSEIINTKTYYTYMLGAICTNDDGTISYSEILQDEFYQELIANIYQLEATP
jgi:hypothetical protein|tara:strand:+ start:120 stop:368 length:249 start_codon:yes stop_codon:yes gene_type:complete